MGAGYYAKRAVDSFYRRATWKEKFALLPQRCELSDRRIWLKKAFIGTSVLTGPGSDIIEYRWHDAHEHTMWLLKRDR